MDTDRKRVVKTRNNGAVAAGSVWESRMRSDQVKGGVKVFNADDQEENVVENISPKLRTKQGGGGVAAKRKTWKSEKNSDGFDKNPIQIAKQKAEKEKNLGQECKELSVIKRSPVRVKNAKSEFCDGNEKSPVQIMKTRSLLQSGSDQSCDEMEKNSVFLRKVKSEGSKALDECGEENVESSEKIETKRCDEIVKEFGVCEEKEITSNLDDLGLVKVKSSPKLDDCDENCDAVMVEEIEGEAEKNDIEIKEMDESERKPNSPVKTVVMEEEKKNYQRNERSMPLSTIVRKQPPFVNNARVVPKPTITKPVPIADETEEVDKSHSKLQSLVDLVMWTDASKSAFVFGMGTFAILSSSYTKDFNISFISVLSYVGLVYLAAVFIFRSLISRGDENTNEKSHDHVVGEEEAVWFVKLILPYINELFLNVRALFSGDPATTMKLAVLLFVLARCGSSLTIWKMAKLGFFGVFTVPKICSSYSTQLTEYGTFWIRRFRDAWESCSHKKAVAFGIFTLVWNLSSTVARIWAVFILYVGFRYYQQKMVREEWAGAETTGLNQTSWEAKKGQNEGQKKGQIGVGVQRKGHGPSPGQVKKQSKWS